MKLITSIIAAVVAAAIAAVIGANSSRKTRTIDVQSQQLRDLENRNAARKYEIYKPVIDLYSVLLSPHGLEAKRWRERYKDADIEEMLDDFAKWVAIYGPDDVVVKFHNFSETLNSLQGREKDIWLFLPLLYRWWEDPSLLNKNDISEKATGSRPETLPPVEHKL